MPPKTKDATDASASSGEGAWKWTAENDRTIFLMILGRGNLGREDYEKIAAALSPNVNWNGVRQRVSKFRGEQKKKFEELGWEVAETPVKSKTPATPRKRKGSEDDEGEETPSRRPQARAKKAVDSEEVGVKEDPGEESV